MLFLIIKILISLVLVLFTVAIFTLYERKFLASFQRRKGPNVVGISGIFQPFSDGLKLLIKEFIIPLNSDPILFLTAPFIIFCFGFLSWNLIPFETNYIIGVDTDINALIFFFISTLNVYGILLAGWGSNSKYAFLGAIRCVAQIISYELCFGFFIIIFANVTNSLKFSVILSFQKELWFIFPLFPIFIIYFIFCLAETNRHPFDLPEAEAELVAGYNVEYSSMGFTLFFLAEYSSILLISLLASVLFLGGNHYSLISIILFYIIILIFTGNYIYSLIAILLTIIGIPGKTILLSTCFIFARAILPRYRYDQLIMLGWKVFLPASLLWFIVISTFKIL